jgi:hypothetical protein
MSDDSVSPLEALVLRLLAGMEGAVAGTLVGGPIGGVVLGTAAVATGEAASLANLNHIIAEHRARKMWSDIRAVEDAHTEAVRAVIEDSMKGKVKKEFAAVVLESVRRVEDVLDEDMIPPLGILIRDYLDPLRVPDTFCRSVAKMLVDCDAQGLADLRAVIAEIKLKFPSIPAQVIVTAHPFTFGQGAERILTFRDESDQQTRPVTGTRRGGGPPMVNPPSGPEVPGFTRDRAAMAVLRLSSPGVGYPRSETDTQGVALSSETIRRLAGIIGTKTPTT